MFKIQNGCQNYEVIQHENGVASVLFSGEYAFEGNDSGYTIAAFDEATDEPIVAWTPVTLCDGKWELVLPLPVGGPYRIEFRTAPPSRTRPSRCVGMLHHVCVGDVFLIAGQSNSAGTGRGELTEMPEIGVHALRDCKYWDLATNPMYAERGFHGPYIAFAKRMKHALHYPIGLIPCGYGGSMLTHWLPDEDGRFYREMVEAVNGKKVRAVLWYQGESDAIAAVSDTYYDRFIKFLNFVRRDIDADLPILTVQLNRHLDDFDDNARYDREYDALREAQRRLARDVEGVSIIPSIDCGRMTDGIHNSKSANLAIGERMARLALFKLYGIGIDPSAPDVREIRKIGENELLILFDHVQDELMAFHVKNPMRLPILVEDADGVNPITSFRLLGDRISLWTARAVKEKTVVKCQYGKDPFGYIQDYGKQIAVLSFSNVPVSF